MIFANNKVNKITAKVPSGRCTTGTFGVIPPLTIPHPIGKYRSFQTSVRPSFGLIFIPVFGSLENGEILFSIPYNESN